MNLDEDKGQERENAKRLGRQVEQILEGLEYQAGKNGLFSNDSDIGFYATSAFEGTSSLLSPDKVPNHTCPRTE